MCECLVVLDAGLLPATLITLDLFLEGYGFVSRCVDATSYFDDIHVLLEFSIELPDLHVCQCNLSLLDLNLQSQKVAVALDDIC